MLLFFPFLSLLHSKRNTKK
uniref:Uncharacterized protein n=1 Tax=Anguilla anguilla TaxID=7936 RepID=A0A0E9VU57_ANGAN